MRKPHLYLLAGLLAGGLLLAAGPAGAAAAATPGSLDSSFGTGGKVLTGTGNGPFTALGLDAAGDIFTLPALTEFSPAGQADGTATAAAITASSHGGDVAIGFSEDNTTGHVFIALARYNG